jgi:diguanylate cyclase (GGDEF)-like protein
MISIRYYNYFDEDLLRARYLSLLPYVPVVIVAAVVAMLTQISVFHATEPVLWSFVIPGLLTVVSAGVFVYWFFHRKEQPDIAIVRRRLQFFSSLLVVAGITTIICDLHLLQHSAGCSRYFLIVQMTLYGICFPFLLVSLGRPAYIYNLMLIATTVFYLLYADVEYAQPFAFMILVFETGMLTAMHRRNKSFDSLVFSSLHAQQLAKENARLANVDILTQLPNRRQFFAAIKAQSLDHLKATGMRFAIGIIDLDRFKLVNDSHGHRVGDLVLVEIARRLREYDGCHQPISFYRLGGDEFAFHKHFGGDEAGLKSLGQALIALIEQPVSVEGLVFHLSASTGIAVFPDVDESTEKLYEYADYALYQAKNSGRGHPELFSPQHLGSLQTRIQIERALRGANIHQEFFTVFQPIVNTVANTPVAFECLARWRSPEIGFVMPNVFIPVAESIGLISNITLVLFDQAIEAMHSWPEDVGLSFNLSAHDVTNEKLIDELVNSGVRAQRFTFELTETALLQDFASTRKSIELLRQAGVGLALDDFGTGYSSLSHVQGLPLNKIKVDRSFVYDIETNPKSKMIVSSILVLCRGIGIDCVVEGAESKSQIELLQAMGCHIIQGFYYAQPMNAQAIPAFLATTSSPH